MSLFSAALTYQDAPLTLIRILWILTVCTSGGVIAALVGWYVIVPLHSSAFHAELNLPKAAGHDGPYRVAKRQWRGFQSAAKVIGHEADYSWSEVIQWRRGGVRGCMWRHFLWCGRIWRRYKTALGAPGRVYMGRAYDH
jgi:hypothetical protein